MLSIRRCIFETNSSSTDTYEDYDDYRERPRAYQTVYFKFKFTDDFMENLTDEKADEWWQDFYEKFEKVQDDFRDVLAPFSWSDFSYSELEDCGDEDTEDTFTVRFKVFLLYSNYEDGCWDEETSEFLLNDTKAEEECKIAVLNFIKNMGVHEIEKIIKIDYNNPDKFS